jgi:nitrogen fixation/metabolism regulation signal transduction histidine kinase
VIRKLQDVSIQGKLFIVFGIVFAAGILAVSWNTWNLYRAKQDITASIKDTQETVTFGVSTNRNQVAGTLQTNRDTVYNALYDTADQVYLAFGQVQELLFLQQIQAEFREMEAIYHDYQDSHSPQSVQAFSVNVGYLTEDITLVRDSATNDAVRQAMTDILPEVEYQNQQFQQVVALAESDPDQAGQLTTDAINHLINNVYSRLNDLLPTQQTLVRDNLIQTQELPYDTADQTAAELDNSIATTDTQMQGLVDDTNANMQAAVDDVESDFERAILISLLIVVLFVVAAVVVIAAIIIVARQIVQPMLKLSDVAELIEKEEYQTEEPELVEISERQDEIGTLARVFNRMAKEVFTRVEKLKQQVAELKIVIDETKMAAQVSEITENEYFTDLQARVKAMRKRKTGESDAAPETPPDAPIG